MKVDKEVASFEVLTLLKGAELDEFCSSGTQVTLRLINRGLSAQRHITVSCVFLCAATITSVDESVRPATHGDTDTMRNGFFFHVNNLIGHRVDEVLLEDGGNLIIEIRSARICLMISDEDYESDDWTWRVAQEEESPLSEVAIAIICTLENGVVDFYLEKSRSP